MAFRLTQPKQISQWVDYIDGEVKAKIKIRGIEYKPYKAARERVDTAFLRNLLNIEELDPSTLTHQGALFKIAGEYLIDDWQEIAVEKEGEVKDIPYTKENAFELMNFGGEKGLEFYLFVLGNASIIQTEADAYKEEILGKFEISTDGQKSEVAKKQKSETK